MKTNPRKALSPHFASRGNNLDLKQLRPQLSGHKQPVARRVVRDAVQYRIWVRQFAPVDQSGQIDPTQYLPCPWRDARDLFAVPDVRVDLIVDVFEFVQLLDRMSSLVGHMNATLLAKILRIEKAQISRSIAQDQLLAVVRQAPALALVFE